MFARNRVRKFFFLSFFPFVARDNEGFCFVSVLQSHYEHGICACRRLCAPGRERKLESRRQRNEFRRSRWILLNLRIPSLIDKEALGHFNLLGSWQRYGLGVP